MNTTFADRQSARLDGHLYIPDTNTLRIKPPGIGGNFHSPKQIELRPAAVIVGVECETVSGCQARHMVHGI